MTKADKKTWGIVGAIVGVVAVAVAVQAGRFWSATKDLANGTTIVIPKSYFPFNGSYVKSEDKLNRA